MKEVLVYFISGFMDSGKTSLIKETIIENDFLRDSKTLILQCEEGDEGFSKKELENPHIALEVIEKKEDYNLETLNQLDQKHQPENVFIEYNGMWEYDLFLESGFPKGWVLAQSLATVDATTFDMYNSNMRVMVMEQLFKAEVVIINRCNENTPKAKYRQMIKSFNMAAQVVFERMDGSIDQSMEELPYDLSSDKIRIGDENYGIFFTDIMEHPQKYDGKIITFVALIYNPDKMKKGRLIPGRFVITCCEEDMRFMGLVCKYEDSKAIPHKSWQEVTGRISYEFSTQYKGKGPVLYLTSYREVEKPLQDKLYFT